MSVATFVVICGALASVRDAGVPGGIDVIFAPLVGITFGALPLVWLMFRRKSRLGKFAGQLPEALELVVRAVTGRS